MNDINKHNINDNYLIEIPRDYLCMKINQMEDALNKCVTKIVIELKQKDTWPTQLNKYNNINWKYNLTIGDIIIILDESQSSSKWYESVIRNRIGNDLYVHWICHPLKWNTIINIDKYKHKIDKRGSKEVSEDNYYSSFTLKFTNEYFVIEKKWLT